MKLQKAIIITIILIIGWSVFVNVAEADNICLSWTAPIVNADGSELKDLAGYHVYKGQESGQYPSAVYVPGPNNTTYCIDDLPAGDNFFAITALDDAGNESGYSNEATTAPNPPPAPPTGLTVTADDMGAYNIVKATNTIMLTYIGTVPAGTPCNGSVSANGRYGVPVEAVDWAPNVTVEPVVVVADCE